MESIFVVVAEFAAVTRTVIGKTFVAVGVPDMVPEAGSSVRPAGREPE